MKKFIFLFSLLFAFTLNGQEIISTINSDDPSLNQNNAELFPCAFWYEFEFQILTNSCSNSFEIELPVLNGVNYNIISAPSGVTLTTNSLEISSNVSGSILISLEDFCSYEPSAGANFDVDFANIGSCSPNFTSSFNISSITNSVLLRSNNPEYLLGGFDVGTNPFNGVQYLYFQNSSVQFERNWNVEITAGKVTNMRINYFPEDEMTLSSIEICNTQTPADSYTLTASELSNVLSDGYIQFSPSEIFPVIFPSTNGVFDANEDHEFTIKEFFVIGASECTDMTNTKSYLLLNKGCVNKLNPVEYCSGNSISVSDLICPQDCFDILVEDPMSSFNFVGHNITPRLDLCGSIPSTFSFRYKNSFTDAQNMNTAESGIKRLELVQIPFDLDAFVDSDGNSFENINSVEDHISILFEGISVAIDQFPDGFVTYADEMISLNFDVLVSGNTAMYEAASWSGDLPFIDWYDTGIFADFRINSEFNLIIEDAHLDFNDAFTYQPADGILSENEDQVFRMLFSRDFEQAQIQFSTMCEVLENNGPHIIDYQIEYFNDFLLTGFAEAESAEIQEEEIVPIDYYFNYDLFHCQNAGCGNATFDISTNPISFKRSGSLFLDPFFIQGQPGYILGTNNPFEFSVDYGYQLVFRVRDIFDIVNGSGIQSDVIEYFPNSLDLSQSEELILQADPTPEIWDHPCPDFEPTISVIKYTSPIIDEETLNGVVHRLAKLRVQLNGAECNTTEFCTADFPMEIRAIPLSQCVDDLTNPIFRKVGPDVTTQIYYRCDGPCEGYLGATTCDFEFNRITYGWPVPGSTDAPDISESNRMDEVEAEIAEVKFNRVYEGDIVKLSSLGGLIVSSNPSENPIDYLFEITFDSDFPGYDYFHFKGGYFELTDPVINISGDGMEFCDYEPSWIAEYCIEDQDLLSDQDFGFDNFGGEVNYRIRLPSDLVDFVLSGTDNRQVRFTGTFEIIDPNGAFDFVNIPVIQGQYVSIHSESGANNILELNYDNHLQGSCDPWQDNLTIIDTDIISNWEFLNSQSAADAVNWFYLSNICSRRFRGRFEVIGGIYGMDEFPNEFRPLFRLGDLNSDLPININLPSNNSLFDPGSGAAPHLRLFDRDNDAFDWTPTDWNEISYTTISSSEYNLDGLQFNFGSGLEDYWPILEHDGFPIEMRMRGSYGTNCPIQFPNVDEAQYNIPICERIYAQSIDPVGDCLNEASLALNCSVQTGVDPVTGTDYSLTLLYQDQELSPPEVDVFVGQVTGCFNDFSLDFNNGIMAGTNAIASGIIWFYIEPNSDIEINSISYTYQSGNTVEIFPSAGGSYYCSNVSAAHNYIGEVKLNYTLDPACFIGDPINLELFYGFTCEEECPYNETPPYSSTAICDLNTFVLNIIPEPPQLDLQLSQEPIINGSWCGNISTNPSPESDIVFNIEISEVGQFSEVLDLSFSVDLYPEEMNLDCIVIEDDFGNESILTLGDWVNTGPTSMEIEISDYLNNSTLEPGGSVFLEFKFSGESCENVLDNADFLFSVYGNDLCEDNEVVYVNSILESELINLGITDLYCLDCYCDELFIIADYAVDCGVDYVFSALFGVDLSSCSSVDYIWDFGDGSPTEGGASVSHSFDNAGTYLVNLTVLCDKIPICSTSSTVQIECETALCFQQSDISYEDVNPHVNIGNDVLAYGLKHFVVGDVSYGSQANQTRLFNAKYDGADLLSADNWWHASAFGEDENSYNNLRILSKGQNALSLGSLKDNSINQRYFLLTEWDKESGLMESYTRFKGSGKFHELDVIPYDFSDQYILQVENIYPVIGAVGVKGKKGKNIFASRINLNDFSTYAKQYGSSNQIEIGKAVLTDVKETIVFSDLFSVEFTGIKDMHVMRLNYALDQVMSARIFSGTLFEGENCIENTEMSETVMDAVWIDEKPYLTGFVKDEENKRSALIACLDPASFEICFSSILNIDNVSLEANKIRYYDDLGMYVVGELTYEDGDTRGFVANFSFMEEWQLNWFKITNLEMSSLNGLDSNGELLYLTGIFHDDSGEESRILNIVSDAKGDNSCCLIPEIVTFEPYGLCTESQILKSTEFKLTPESAYIPINVPDPEIICADNSSLEDSNEINPKSSISNSVAVVPNPSNAIFRISLLEDIDEDLSSYKVYDLDGALIQSKNFGPDSNQQIFDLNMSEFSSGFYLVELRTTKGNVYREKISLMK